MSREDPQLRIRLPIELKEKIEDSAKANNRSMNAEIVQKLDGSFLAEVPEDEVISAEEAIQIVSRARDELSAIIFKRTFSEINKKVRIGHTTFHIHLSDLELDGLSDDDFETVFQKAFIRLRELGYEIWDKTWDVSGFTAEIPEKNPT
ncbi:Arc family DNA-binding protein [Citrobacter amalonaticus]|uniref:Arc family DNA-binding protein n=1 Tax=Citrobacter amalonaticus TaxID=35703 RepID=UPI0005CB2E81|nr:Arc family DNA-binding protein [Citrobacter amalonaticus]EKW5059620.1 Arc family DNA-binding protein [Citrobacter amalonaticus]ELT8118282.1 Arc family DNA-binding protein [Citrobacter amalonaticus]HEM6698843.1 Arc family DNA-binding protein [Citrobacter amalonaticus]HEM7436250.1 Arc family DNA-binding protein [Citrobacter amalonaticus]HEM8516607.1 Arc family DNA-binding protein [Citrobacter amalonaticus]